LTRSRMREERNRSKRRKNHRRPNALSVQILLNRRSLDYGFRQ
jgi:hypothetical protein